MPMSDTLSGVRTRCANKLRATRNKFTRTNGQFTNLPRLDE